MEVGVRLLKNLMDPVGQLDVGVSPHLAENRRTLQGAIGEFVQLPEERCAADVGHGLSPLIGLIGADASRSPRRRIAYEIVAGAPPDSRSPAEPRRTRKP